MKPARAPPPVPHRLSLHRGSIKDEGRGGQEGETGEGVTYGGTQNAFWTVGEEDEKVAFVSGR